MSLFWFLNAPAWLLVDTVLSPLKKWKWKAWYRKIWVSKNRNSNNNIKRTGYWKKYPNYSWLASNMANANKIRKFSWIKF